MRGFGAMKPNGARVLSYLLFEGAYCRERLRLAQAGRNAQRARILSFLGHGAASPRSADPARGTRLCRP
jgi:NTE family protein